MEICIVGMPQKQTGSCRCHTQIQIISNTENGLSLLQICIIPSLHPEKNKHKF